MSKTVQAFATVRNEQVEMLVDYILRRFSSAIETDGMLRQAAIPVRHVSFSRNDASDIFDHYLELNFNSNVGDLNSKVQLWGQTTCYKGSKTGRPESNKTYEVRETLIEALYLRRWLRAEGVGFRTIHFTVGPSEYTYGWFAKAKENAFDLSVYLQTTVGDLFAELTEILAGVTIEHQVHLRLLAAEEDPNSAVGAVMQEALNALLEWFSAGMPRSHFADEQADLLQISDSESASSTERALRQSLLGGADIKGRAIRMLAGETDFDEDPAMLRMLEKLNLANPFLSVALSADIAWSTWAPEAFAVPAGVCNLEEYVDSLWNVADDVRLINRRLLLRIHSRERVHYPQDVGIVGLTEHNLYNGEHSLEQSKEVITLICASCRAAGITSPSNLSDRLSGRLGRRLLKLARRAESINGTNIKPSFFYVEERLKDEFLVLRLRDTQLPPPIAYHASFGTARVDAYDNLKVVVSKKTKLPLSILKVKYYREQEFPRRAKEEAYVALTARFELIEQRFIERYPGIPMIMFVDMDADLAPPEHAIRRLSTSGWIVYFAVEELILFLRTLDG